ncbi:hypothetical protein BKA56DRAFT_573316 [Ilyonectria sp. MPI-CAGE-AT-0026]|nr:hypothetical protein BKA56DRAFT_573316 [Ilyonectria sp. MPI-CAGE-AT-0026]
MGVADGAAVTPERVPYDGRTARHFAICGVYLELRRGTANSAVHPLPLSLSLPFLVLALVALSSWLCGLGPSKSWTSLQPLTLCLTSLSHSLAVLLFSSMLLATPTRPWVNAAHHPGMQFAVPARAISSW